MRKEIEKHNKKKLMIKEKFGFNICTMYIVHTYTHSNYNI